MITVCFLFILSFITFQPYLALAPMSFLFLQLLLNFHSNLSTPNTPSLSYFFSFLAFITFQYTILCCYLLCLVLVSPHKTVSQVETLSVLVTTVLQHLEQCSVVNTHLLTGANEGTQTSEVSEGQARSQVLKICEVNK